MTTLSVRADWWRLVFSAVSGWLVLNLVSDTEFSEMMVNIGPQTPKAHNAVLLSGIIKN